MYECINYLNNTNTNVSSIYNYIYYFFCNSNNFDNFYYINFDTNININISKINDINYYLVNYPETRQIFYIIVSIIFLDYNLIFLFGSKARWFQLHSIVNLIVTISIVPELLNIINNPLIEYTKKNNNFSTYYILFLHIYHILTFKNLTFYDYFHHILFVGFGVFPTLLFVKTNFYYFAYIACGGIPGIIEYGLLTLFKNNLLTLKNQKKINSLLYNYFRYPLCLFGVTYNFVAYKIGIMNENLFLVIYLNFLLYLNGAFFNYLTLESYYRVKNKNENIAKIIYSKKTKKIE